MKPRILYLVFLACLLGLLLTSAALAGGVETEATSGTCGENLTWSLDTETGVLTISGTGDMMDWGEDYPWSPWSSCYSPVKTAVIEPGVTSIGDYAFYSCQLMTSISIPDSVTKIGSMAFRNCESLSSITIPKSVKQISTNAFRNCSTLTDVYIDDLAAWCEISFDSTSANPLGIAENLYVNGELLRDLVIPEGVTAIGNNAFAGYGALTSVTIPEGVSSIGDNAFDSCVGLTSVRIANTVTSIGDLAFRGCGALSSVNFPNGLTYIGYMTFANCTSLASATIPNSMDYISAAAFEGCTGLTSVSIPNSIIDIGYYAFNGCTALTSLKLPNSILSLGTGAFGNCTALTTVNFPEGIKSTGDAVFENCISLTSVTIPDSVTTINSAAFSGCTGLTSVNIPSGVTSIGYAAFSDCSALTSVTIPDGVTSIGTYAFSGCKGLTSVSIPSGVSTISANAFRACSGLLSVSIPNGVTTIDDYAFYQCYALTSVAIPSSVNEIGYYAFFNCVALKDVYISDIAAWCGISFDSTFGNPLYHARNLYVNGTLTRDLVIPEGVSTVRPHAFSHCDFLTSLTLPKSLKTIESSAFYHCSGLTSVNFSDQLTSIAGGAFSYCSGLTSVTIPNGVTSIGNIAFLSCSSLTSVTIPPSVTVIDTSAFEYCDALTDVHISDLAAWCAISFGDHWSNPVQYSKRLILNGEEIRELVIPEGVSSIGDYAFMCCSGISSVQIPSSVTSIGREAFYECSGMRSVNIPEGVTTIGGNAFRSCKSLPYVSIPSSVSSIGGFAFFGCDKSLEVRISDLSAWCSIAFTDNQANPLHCGGKLVLNGTEVRDLVIPDDVTSICDYAFVYCKNLTSVTIPETVTSIGSYAFLYCSGLTSVNIPDSVTSIKDSAFSDCGSLVSVSIPNSITTIESLVFADCSGLESIVIPDSVTSIGFYAFSGCSSLKSIVIPDSVTKIKSSAFEDCSSLTSVTLSNNIKSIQGYAFDNCSSLTYVVIPQSVTKIYEYAFRDCAALKKVFILNPSCEIYNSGVSFAEDAGGAIYAHADTSVEAYAQACGYDFYPVCACTEYPCECKLETVEPNCTEEGYTRVACSKCSTAWPISTVEPTGHSYTSVVTKPSPTEQGYTTYTCTVCADSYVDTHSAEEPHRFGPWTMADYKTHQRSCCCGETESTRHNWDNELCECGVYSGFCGYDSIWILLPDTGELIVLGEGDIMGKVFGNNLDWEPYRFEIKTVVIEDGITYIGGDSFRECTQLTSVSIPNGVTTIGPRAFYECYALPSVTLPESVTLVEEAAFSNCSALEKIYVLNPSCNIQDDLTTMPPCRGGAIYGHPDSTAEAYAEKYGYKFYRLCECEDYACNYTSKTVGASCTEDGYTQLTCSECGYTYIESYIAAPGHTPAYTDNGNMTHTVSCENCDAAETADCVFEDGECICGAIETTGPIYDGALQFSHSLTLENDISINFIGKAEQLDAYDSFYLECTVPVYNGNEKVGTKTVELQPYFNGTNYEFMLDGLTAKMMNDEIEAVFRLTKKGKEYYSKTDIYSIAEYAYSMLEAENSSDSLKTICANLLRYGALAQQYFNYRTDALVDAAMTDTHKSYLTDLSTVEMVEYRKQLPDHDAPTVPWKSTGLELGNKVIMCLMVNLKNYTGNVEDLTMRLSYTNAKGKTVSIDRPLELLDAENQIYAVNYDGLRATEMRIIVSAAIYEGESRVSKTVEYNIESYGARMAEGSFIKELCCAMLAYGDSAAAFFAN